MGPLTTNPLLFSQPTPPLVAEREHQLNDDPIQPYPTQPNPTQPPPSMGAMVEAARGTGLSVRKVRDIGPDYAITLRAWREAWEREREVRVG
jgi:hypothetical protein